MNNARSPMVLALLGLAGVLTAAEPAPAPVGGTPAPAPASTPAPAPAVVVPPAAPVATPAAVPTPPGVQPPPAAVPAPVTPPVPAPAATAPAAEKPKPFREQSIYVPYRKLRDVFERTGRTVFLPYNEFLELWEAARGKAEVKPPPDLPVDALIAEFAATATVSRDVMTVSARVRVDVLKEGWNRVSLRLADAALTKAILDDSAPAHVVYDKDQGYVLLLEKPGKEPRQFLIDIEFAKAFTKAPGQNTVSFENPPATVSCWDVRIPEPGIKLSVQPAMATTDVPAPATGATQTQVLAFVGPAPTVRFEWTPKAEGARGLAALASAQAEQQVWVDEGILRSRVRLSYDISRAELSTFTVEVPAEYRVSNVFDPNVREWQVAAAGAVQTITVQTFEPAKVSQALVIEIEKPLADAEVAVPVVKAGSVGRQQGVVLVKVADGLRAEVLRRDGLLQVDAGELPAESASGGWQYCYRYASLPFALTLKTEKVLPHVVAETLVEVHLQPEELTVDLLARFDVQRAGVFQFVLQVPPNCELRNLRGEAIGEATPVEVENHNLDPAVPGRLLVNLARRAQGRVGLALQLHRALQEPDLVSPTGKTVDIPVPLPRVERGSVARENGRLVVYGPESLRLNPAPSKGLRAITHEEASRDLRPAKPQATERAVLAYAYSDEQAALALRAERRRPQITVRQFLTARIESGAVKYEAILFYEVLYSGVKTLRLDVPAAPAERLRVTSADIRQSGLELTEPERASLAAGYVAWALAGETEFIGNRQVRLSWETGIETLDIGKSTEFSVPRLDPRGVDRAWGQIVLAKTEAVDVAPVGTPTGLRPIDPQQDLMPGVSSPGAARAFEFHDEWSLTVKATRYEPQQVKSTSVEKGLVRAVVTRGGTVSVQALYRLRSIRQRLAIRLPVEVEFDTQPLRLNGRPVALEQGEAGEYFVPLVGQTPDQPFLLDLRYLVRGGARLRFEPPGFPQEPAVQQIYLSGFVPNEQALLGVGGPWEPELVWELVWTMRGLRFRPRASRTSDWLVGWVSGGLPVEAKDLLNFPTDGQHLLFSTLHPPLGPAGALQLTCMPGWLLAGLVLVLIVGAGLVLLPAGFAPRALTVGAFLVASALLAAFTPTLVRTVLGHASLAVFVVVVLWGLWYLVVTRPRRPRPVTPPAVPPPDVPGPAADTGLPRPESTVPAPAAPQAGGPTNA